MTALYPIQDVFVRGEASPRLHARASLDLYRAALSKCENFLTLPHGGLRKRGGTYFVGEVKDSSKKVRGIPFIFSSDQAYFLEVGDLYLRVYAYGVRVGTVELVTPWTEADLPEIQFYQSGDVMWIVHPDHKPQVLTRSAHTTWTLSEFVFEDGPYLPINTRATTLTPSDYGALTPVMTGLSAPSGTVSSTDANPDAWKVFDKDGGTYVEWVGSSGFVSYALPSGQSAIVDHYFLTAPEGTKAFKVPISWRLEGSNNGTTWVTIDTRQGESGWLGGETRFFSFTNKASYRYHRFSWLSNGDTTSTGVETGFMELGLNRAAASQTPFNLTASSTTGINKGAGFRTSDVGRSIRLLGSDNQWRWARIESWVSSTVVKITLNGHALPDLSPIINWRLGAFDPNTQVEGVTLFEERLAFSQRFSIYASKTGVFESFAVGEKDDDALEFLQAGGGQANDIVWIADADGFLLIATAGGIRAMSGSGIDEALTPSSFKNRKSRTFGAAKIRPVDAGQSFLYVTRSRKTIAELVQNQSGRFTSEDIGQISEHIPKKGVVEIAFQNDPDPLLWFPLDNGEVGGYTHQPSQEVRGMHRHRIAGTFGGSTWGIVESMVVTPGQNGADDVWLIVKRTIGGTTKRFIEILTPAFEYDSLQNAFQVDCGLSYSGAATNTVTGLSHLNGQKVDVLAGGKVYKGLTVSGGSVSLPGGVTASKWHVGLPFAAEANTLELDVGGRDGSRVGRRKKVSKLILSVMETDTTGLSIRSMQRGRWETVKIPSIVAPDGSANLYTGDIEVPIDDSWEGQGRVIIKHENPTPCTIRAITPVFDAEP